MNCLNCSKELKTKNISEYRNQYQFKKNKDFCNWECRDQFLFKNNPPIPGNGICLNCSRIREWSGRKWRKFCSGYCRTKFMYTNFGHKEKSEKVIKRARQLRWEKKENCHWCTQKISKKLKIKLMRKYK